MGRTSQTHSALGEPQKALPDILKTLECCGAGPKAHMPSLVMRASLREAAGQYREGAADCAKGLRICRQLNRPPWQIKGLPPPPGEEERRAAKKKEEAALALVLAPAGETTPQNPQQEGEEGVGEDVFNPEAVQCRKQLEATLAVVREGQKHLKRSGQVDSPAVERVFDVTREGVAKRPAEQTYNLLRVGRSQKRAFIEGCARAKFFAAEEAKEERAAVDKERSKARQKADRARAAVAKSRTARELQRQAERRAREAEKEAARLAEELRAKLLEERAEERERRLMGHEESLARALLVADEGAAEEEAKEAAIEAELEADEEDMGNLMKGRRGGAGSSSKKKKKKKNKNKKEKE